MFIRVVPYDPFWEVEYENESQKIRNILKEGDISAKAVITEHAKFIFLSKVTTKILIGI